MFRKRLGRDGEETDSDCTSTIGLEATVSSLLHRFGGREVTESVILVMIVPSRWDCAGSTLGRSSALAKGEGESKGD